MQPQFSGTLINMYDLPAINQEVLQEQIEGRSHWVALCLESSEDGNVSEGRAYPIRVGQILLRFGWSDPGEGSSTGLGLLLEGDIEELLLDTDIPRGRFAIFQDPVEAEAADIEELKQRRACEEGDEDRAFWTGQTQSFVLTPDSLDHLLEPLSVDTDYDCDGQYAVINLPRYRDRARPLLNLTDQGIILGPPELPESQDAPCLIVRRDSLLIEAGLLILFQNDSLAHRYCFCAHQVGIRAEDTGPSLTQFSGVHPCTQEELEAQGDFDDVWEACDYWDAEGDEEDEDELIYLMQECRLMELASHFGLSQEPLAVGQCVDFKEGMCSGYDIEPDSPLVVMEVLNPPVPNTLPQTESLACERWDTIVGLLDEDGDLLRRYVDSRRLTPKYDEE